MIYRSLGGASGDLAVSAIAIGAANFGGLGSARRWIGRGDSEADAHALLDRAYALGINLVDTAATYADGASEQIIGNWLRARGPAVRGQIRISSKVGLRGGLGRAHVLAEVDRSLARLGVDAIDLYLAHVPDLRTPWDEVRRTFELLLERGKVRRIGLSNVSAEQIAAAGANSTGGFGVVQNQLNLLHLGDTDNGVLASCARHGLAYAAYAPLAGGLLGGRYALTGAPPADSRIARRADLYGAAWTEANARRVAWIAAGAAARGVSTAGLAVWWLVHCPQVSTILLGAREPVALTQIVEDALRLPADPALWRALAGPAPERPV